MARLSDRIDHILGAKAASKLGDAFGIATVEDLLRHYPARYATPGQPLVDPNPPEGSHVTASGDVVKTDLVPMKSRKGFLLKAIVDDGRQHVSATFFNGKATAHTLKEGKRVMMSGTVKYFKEKWSLTQPGFIVLPDRGADGAATGGTVRGGGSLAGLARNSRESGEFDLSILDRHFLPVYPATNKVESWDILFAVKQVLDQLDTVEDPLPESIRRSSGLMGLDDALRLVHFPDAKSDYQMARDRLRFDEAAALQLVLAQRRQDMTKRAAPACPPRADGVAAAFADRLPFELTAGQRDVVAEISADLTHTWPMSRLLQGEVGSGKTIVSLLAMLQTVDAGYQCALLAPTEVLAAQHYRSLRAMLGELGAGGELGAADNATRIELLTGSMSTAAKRAALLAAVSGAAGIVIGTHALIQDNVEFFRLGMVVVDEQHRFGVEQRDALRAKARDGVTPHLLVMTATPIPRTIAMTTLGDLETSTLRELPRGRSPIKTSVVPAATKPQWVERAWARIVEEVAAGRQAYVVCSRIGDEKPGKKDDEKEPTTHAVLDLFDELRYGPFASVRVGLLHGRLPADDKDAAMRAFNDGETDVLVCTTVVEVGVDVPNATVMVIVDADRFGVSQLHQLRGRIGRGGHAGLCILITESSPFAPSYTRLEQVAATTDGFELAQLDLADRREGDILGAAQSGTSSTLRLLSLLEHTDVIEAAQRFARAIVDEDPGLRHHPGLAAMTRSALDAERLDYLQKS